MSLGRTWYRVYAGRPGGPFGNLETLVSSHEMDFPLTQKKTKQKMLHKLKTIKSLVHKIRLHDRRGKEMAESFPREKLR